MIGMLYQCLEDFWMQYKASEDVALVQTFVADEKVKRVEVSYVQMFQWQQELRTMLRVESDEWIMVGINLAPFSIEETATMLLVAEERNWVYVPIDVELPLPRQLSLLQSAGVHRLVTTTTSALAEFFKSNEQVELRTVKLKSSPFSSVQVVKVVNNYFGEEESELECTRRRLTKEEDLKAPLYVLFTSGTTGNPRGVLGTRAGAWTRLQWMWTTYPFAFVKTRRTSERVLRATKLSFVDSVWEILGAFLQRVPLVHLQVPQQYEDSAPCYMKNVVFDDRSLFLEIVRTENVSRFTAVPSVLEVLLLQTTEKDRHLTLSGLRYLISSGESLPLHVVQQLTTNLPDVTVLNLYGSTEVSGDVTCMELKAPFTSAQIAEWQQNGVPIAKLDRYSVVGDETSLALLSDDLENNACPSKDDATTVIWPRRNVSEISSCKPTRGVLYVSGPLLTLGYVGDGYEDVFVGSDELLDCQDDSKQEQVVQPRRFCTGDICSVIQGHLYFCGRKDNAVKIHGQRVYLEGVERAVASALKEIAEDTRFAGGHQVIAFTTTKKVGKYALKQQRIVACVICDDVRSSVARYNQTRTLHAWITEHYGASHIPHDILLVPTNAVIRLAHGKIDRRALEMFLDHEHDTSDSSVALPNPKIEISASEKLVARLLKETLDIPLPGYIPGDIRSQTFKDVGGNSLLATLFMYELRQAFGTLPLTSQELLERTIGEVVSALGSLSEKRPREELTAINSEGAAGELKRMKKIHPALSGESTDSVSIALDGGKQGRLSFLSRYNQSSDDVKGTYFPVCYTSPVQSVSEPAPCLSLELRSTWRIDLGKCIDASPLVVQRRDHQGAVTSTWAIVGSHSAQLVCVDVLASGQDIWRVSLDDRIEACASLSVKLELVYVGTYAGTLFALDLQSGETRWTFQAKGTIKASALVMDRQQLVVCGAYDNHLYGLDAVIGRQRWAIDLQGSIFSTPFYCAWSEQIFAASTNGIVVALTSASSDAAVFDSIKEHWRLKLPAPVFAGLNVDYESKMLIVGCADGQLYGVDMLSGIVQWQLATEKPIFSSPCVYRSRSVVFGSHDGMLRKVDSRTGELVWATNLHGAVFASPTVVRLVAESPNRYVVDKTTEDSDLVCCMATTTGQLCFCNEKTGSIIYQSGNSSGKALNSTDRDKSCGDLGPLFGSPVLIDNWCLLGTRTNFLYGFELVSTNTS